MSVGGTSPIEIGAWGSEPQSLSSPTWERTQRFTGGSRDLPKSPGSGYETSEATEPVEDLLIVEDELIIEDFNIDGICGVY